jgi:hypothetical protein
MFDWWSTDLYLPQIVGACLAGVLTGAVAAVVAWWTARHEVREAEKRRLLEQGERDAQDASMRRDELNQRIVSEFTDALGRTQKMLQRGEVEASRVAVYWVNTRTIQMKMLLHSQERNDLLVWFDHEWGKVMDELQRLVDASVMAGEEYIADGETWDMEVKLTCMEFIFARWAAQPVEQWTAEDPPRELLSPLSQGLDSMSVGGGE